MGTVFLKNATSSSITVAGYTVHYIDSADAEIVEVEGSGGGSTSSDDATGTISGVTLPTAHSYTGVSFDSLRYYAKGTVSNTGIAAGSNYYGQSATDAWYYGTISWTDESIGDLSGKIVTNPPSSNSMAQQSVIRVHVITSGISGYHAYDTLDSSLGYYTGQISEYTYTNGVHSIAFWLRVNWYTGSSYAGRIMLRYLDEITTFTGLNAFDLVNVSNGALSKATTTDRYDMYNTWAGNITVHALYGGLVKFNAFKFTLNNTPYYYVLDGTHDTWTDDLSAWGYSEVQQGPVLPTVTTEGDFSSYNWLRVSSAESVSGGGNTSNLTIDGTNYPDYNAGNSYAILQWQQSGGTTSGRVEFSIVNANGKIQAHNNTSGTLTFYQARVAVCSSSLATVITVYNSSNTAYNSFKFTANNTDYYYVLDGTQTDWVSDLGSIGYYLYPSEFDIDTNWGTAVSIPSGYTVQSVKASRAYAFGTVTWSSEYNPFRIQFNIPGANVYCDDTDTSLLGVGVDPVISLFQITTINSQGSYNGYHVTCRSSQTSARAAESISDQKLNCVSGNYFVDLVAINNNAQTLYTSVVQSMNDGKPLIIRKYDSGGNLISYYMNVPQTLWSFQNGVFSWLGDSTSQSDLAYFYYNLQVRIHCVRT